MYVLYNCTVLKMNIAEKENISLINLLFNPRTWYESWKENHQEQTWYNILNKLRFTFNCIPYSFFFNEHLKYWSILKNNIVFILLHICNISRNNVRWNRRRINWLSGQREQVVKSVNPNREWQPFSEVSKFLKTPPFKILKPIDILLVFFNCIHNSHVALTRLATNAFIN